MGSFNNINDNRVYFDMSVGFYPEWFWSSYDNMDETLPTSLAYAASHDPISTRAVGKHYETIWANGVGAAGWSTLDGGSGPIDVWGLIDNGSMLLIMGGESAGIAASTDGIQEFADQSIITATSIQLTRYTIDRIGTVYIQCAEYYEGDLSYNASTGDISGDISAYTLAYLNVVNKGIDYVRIEGDMSGGETVSGTIKKYSYGSVKSYISDFFSSPYFKSETGKKNKLKLDAEDFMDAIGKTGDTVNPSFNILAQTKFAGNDKITGTSAKDFIDGGFGDDRLSGLEGDDVLIGGAGADTLKGGDGADVFILNTMQERDVIVDFSSGSDRLWLDFTVYDRLMWLTADNYVEGAVALDYNDYLLYDGNNLYYDADANGSGSPVLIVQVKNLEFSDLTVQGNPYYGPVS